jgi:hypothetical protein
VCLLGASWARQHILQAHPDAKVTVFAVWMPMLGGDSRDAWDGNVLNDRRVISLWDAQRLAGTWLADHRTAGLGGPGFPVWDAYLAFPANARWKGELPSEAAAGSTIIDNTRALEQRFVPLLGG